MMRVLETAAYIYDEHYACFTKNKTGYGIVIRDIVQSLSKYSSADVYLVTHAITDAIETDGVHIVRHLWRDVLRNARLADLLRGIQYFFLFRQPLKMRLRYFYYQLDRGYYEHVINQLQPDVVHIHGCLHAFHPYLDACKALGVPYVVTLHGLVGYLDAIRCEQHEVAEERRFLIENQNDNVPVTFVSTGMKERAVTGYELSDNRNIRIVRNGTAFADDARIDSIGAETVRLKHGIPIDAKVCVAIGNVFARKNQMQIVRAAQVLKNRGIDNVYFLILGTVDESYPIEEFICKNELSENVICCGFVERNEIGAYYSAADLNILASVDEGFGLSLIEGFAYGIPAVTFSDLDAVKDLYDDSAMIAVRERNDEALAEAIEAGLSRDWDHAAIAAHAKQFSLKNMAEQYMTVFQQAAADHA